MLDWVTGEIEFAFPNVDFIGKPFKIEEVQARVRTHLSLRQLQAALAAKNRELEASYTRLSELETLRTALVSGTEATVGRPGPVCVCGAQAARPSAAAPIKIALTDFRIGIAEPRIHCRGLQICGCADRMGALPVRRRRSDQPALLERGAHEVLEQRVRRKRL